MHNLNELQPKTGINKYKKWSLEHYQAECIGGYFNPTWIEGGAAFQEYVLRAQKGDFDNQFNLGYYFLHSKRPNHGASQYYYHLADMTIEKNYSAFWGSRAHVLFQKNEQNANSDKYAAYLQLVEDECPMALNVKDFETLDFTTGVLLIEKLQESRVKISKVDVQKWLGFLHFYLQKDAITALEHYELAAKMKDRTSQIAVARICEEGYGCGFGIYKDYAKASVYYRSAGLLKEAENCLLLLRIEKDKNMVREPLENDEPNKNHPVVSNNVTKEAYFYNKICADSGQLNGLSKLGELYSDISKTDASYLKLAKEYNEKAADKGCLESAKRALEVNLQLENYEKAFFYYEQYYASFNDEKLSDRTFALLTQLLFKTYRNNEQDAAIKILKNLKFHTEILLKIMIAELLSSDDTKGMILFKIKCLDQKTLTKAFQSGAKSYGALYYNPKRAEEQALLRMPPEPDMNPYYRRLYDFLKAEGGTDIKSYKYHVVSAFFDYEAKPVEVLSKKLAFYTKKEAKSEFIEKLSAEEFISIVIQALENELDLKQLLIHTMFFSPPVMNVNTITCNALETAIKKGLEKYKGHRGLKENLMASFEDMNEENFLAKLYLFLTGSGGNNLQSFKFQVVSALFNLDEKSIKTDDQAFTVIFTLISQLEKIEGLTRKADSLTPIQEIKSTSKLFYGGGCDEDL